MKFNKLYYEPYKDIFGYHLEIQKINSGFRLFFNKKSKKLSIINIFNNYENCGDFDAIFDININNLRFSKIENINNILNFIDKQNLNLEIKNNEKQQNTFKYISKELIKFSNRTSTITQKDINKIIGVTTKC